MATLTITAEPSENLERYELQLDDDRNDLPMGDENECTVDIDGNCGDGSSHKLHYVLLGEVGATLGLTIKCDDAVVIEVPLEIYEPGPIQRGHVEFEL